MASEAEATEAVRRGEFASKTAYWQKQTIAEHPEAETAFSRISKRETELDKQRQKLEQQRAEALQIWETWQDLLKRRNALKAGIQRAQQRLDYVRQLRKSILDGGKDNLLTGQMGRHGAAEPEIDQLGANLAIQRELLELYPKAIERKQSELEQTEKEVTDYARKHGFTDPENRPEPQPEAETEDDDEDGEESE